MPTAQITQLGRSDAAQVTAVLLGQNGGLVSSRLMGFTTVGDRLAR